MILIEPKVELLKEDNFYSVPFSPVPRDVAGLCADRETGGPASVTRSQSGQTAHHIRAVRRICPGVSDFFPALYAGENLIAGMIFSGKAFFTAQDDCPGGVRHIFFRRM